MGSTKKKILAAMIVFIVIVAGACACRAWVVPALQAQTKAAQEQYSPQSDSDGEDAQDGTDGDSQDAGSAPALTDGQQDRVSSYTKDEKEVSDLLKANIWMGQGTTAQAKFADGYVVESKEGTADESQTFVIDAIQFSQDNNSNSNITKTWTGSAEMGSGTIIFALSQTTPASGVEQPWKITCTGFKKATTYTLASAATSFATSKLSDGVVSLLGGQANIDRMEKQLKDYCARHYPTASIAEWDQKGTLDYKQNTLMLDFTLDNSAKTKVSVMCELGGTGFEIGKA
jgi:hypothetical protein